MRWPQSVDESTNLDREKYLKQTKLINGYGVGIQKSAILLQSSRKIYVISYSRCLDTMSRNMTEHKCTRLSNL